ncbi:MAG: hypothetical protein HY695_16700 [Deltaproteobacteria bacterium]|nr:hypothetical protein [Deltaproteobacteria bacterium]
MNREEYKGYEIEVLPPIEDRIRPSKKAVGPWIPTVRIWREEKGQRKVRELRMNHAFRRKDDAVKASLPFAKASIDSGKLSDDLK